MTALIPPSDRPLLGIVFMLGFCVLAPLGDAVAKLLSTTVPLLMLLIVRFGAQALLLMPLALRGGWSHILRGRMAWLMVLRTVLHILGIGAMFTALRFMPLAETVAIAFVMPFILLFLGAWLLGEQVGPYRIGASIVGFAGTLMVIQPSFAEVGWPALLPLFVAVVFALFMLVTRAMAREVDAVALQAQSGVVAVLLLGLLALLMPSAHVTHAPSAVEWGLLALIGVIGTLAHLLMTWSLRFAPSATLAPMQYLEIPVATLFGWLIFRDLPDGLAALGIAVTVAAGLYVIWREHRLGRAAPAAP